MVYSDSQSKLRIYVLHPWVATRQANRPVSKGFLDPALSDNTWNPTATNMQKPKLGAYNILSATTKPTGKNRLEAGTNGSTIRDKLITTALDR
uniref:Uncharacterized protein n=1 Tax=Arion vulgaris TaxID=1028688 RepID=A0A0B6ZW90_9EUPU